MLIYLTNETNKLAVSLRPLDKAREQLNEKLGITELAVNIPAGGVDGGAATAPTPATSQPLKLFAKLPKQIMDSGLEKPELMRLSAVYELIETEIDYVQDLKTMINVRRCVQSGETILSNTRIFFYVVSPKRSCKPNGRC